MSFPDITELSTAFTLCTCNGMLCSTQCHVCYSPRWSKERCVQQLWREHTRSDAGKEAARRFNDMLREQMDIPLDVNVITGDKQPDPPVPSDAEIVERTIDFAEGLGMYLEPWQAAALRAILLHGGDVAITRGGRGY